MISIGRMPSNTGKPGGKKTGQQMMEYPIDGGLFIEPCKGLVKNQEFDQLWHDRTTNIKLLNINLSEEQEEIADNYSSEDQNTLRILYSSFSIESPIVKVSGADSKSKYHCFNCNINLWRKPYLHIICGICEEEFEEN